MGFHRPPQAPGGKAFPYSLFYVYYEQYGYIRGVAVQNVLLAISAVFAATLLVSSLPVAIAVSVTVLCITVDLIGWIWLLNPHHDVADAEGVLHKYGVDINAVSVVNLVMAVGLAVEFCVHICTGFVAASGSRTARAKQALAEMGSAVVTGITFTKFVGVLVLAWAPSRMFRLYYFRMYLGIILLGAFHGLAVLPAFLSLCGPPSKAVKRRHTRSDDEDEVRGVTE
jgi:Niemann-Pick C1 protein